MVAMANLNLPERAIRQQISSAINVIIQISRMPDGTRKVTNVTEVTGMEGPVITVQDLFVFERQGVDANRKVKGRFQATGIRPKFSEKLQAAGIQFNIDTFFAERQPEAPVILPIVTVMIFLATLGLLMSAAYFLVQAPLEKRKLRVRLEAVQQVSMRTGEADTEIMRREMLSDIAAVHRLLIKTPLIPKIQLMLQQAAVQMQVAPFLLIMLSAGLFTFVVVLVINGSLAFAAMFAVLGAAVPFLVVQFKRQRRFSRFEEQFPDAMDLLARAVRAGHAFTTAFSLIAEEMADPVAEEFRITYSQQNLGLPLRDALANMATRVPLPDVRIFISALQIQRDSGGNLGEILDNLSLVVRERFKILREVQVLTAEGRLSMYTLIALPFIVSLLLYMANPGYMLSLLTDSLGQKALMVAAIMQFIGYLIIRKMVRIKV
jgi:tight adherence protein B